MKDLLTVRDKCVGEIYLLSLYYVTIDLHYLESLTGSTLDDNDLNGQ